MATRPIITLNTTTPQLEVPQAGDTYYFPRQINPGTLTTDVKVIDAAVTWNNAAVTFSAVKVNVTDTASDAASKFVDYQVGGTTKISFGKDGSFSFPNISGSAAGAVTAVAYSHSGAVFKLSSAGIELKDSTIVAWSASANSAGTKDVILYRDAANTLALRNSTNPQAFRVYNTGDSSNGEWGFINWDSNVCKIGATKAGTGTSRDLEIAVDSAKTVIFSNGGTSRFQVSSGYIRPTFDSSYDIGTSSYKFRVVYADELDGSALKMSSLPTSDPTVAGQLWNNSGVLTVSAG